MPLIHSGVSMEPDMKFGWKPKIDISGAPIPLYYDFEPFEIPVNPLTHEEYEPLYLGTRPKHSIEVHKTFANKQNKSYNFKFPPNLSMIE